MSWSIHLGERGSVTELANKANIEGENAIDLGVVEINAGASQRLSPENRQPQLEQLGRLPQDPI